MLPGPKRFRRSIELFGPIDPDASSYKFYGTKVSANESQTCTLSIDGCDAGRAGAQEGDSQEVAHAAQEELGARRQPRAPIVSSGVLQPVPQLRHKPRVGVSLVFHPW